MIKVSRKVSYLIFLVFAACAPNVENLPSGEADAEIFPDYKEVTIPPNIAPLNFSLTGGMNKGVAVMVSEGERLILRSKKGYFNIPEKVWRKMTTPGSVVSVTVAVRKEGRLTAYKPFSIKVSEEEIDPFIAYRLIDPGYETWNNMGLYQRSLGDFTQTPIMTNDLTDKNCMNCHSFCNRDPEKMMFHMRAKNGGTYVWNGGKMEKLNTKTPQTLSALVYPYWHPSGNYIAFSVNDIAQFFHSTNPNRIEVYDSVSDVVVYDVNNREISTSPLLTDSTRLETFPSFSPDGKTLYFCSSPQPEVPAGYDSIRYSICSISFNPEDLSFGEKVDTIYNASARGLGATIPRVSPDGRFLLFAETAYGCFAIWHKDAELRMLDLKDGSFHRMDEINGPDADSYHSWSSNGRWIVWASRRLDGLYSRLFISHIDEEGHAAKPFLLPQKDPNQNLLLMKSYNVPEFISGPVDFNQKEMARLAKDDPGVQVTYTE